MKKTQQLITIFLFVFLIFAVPILAKTEKKNNFLFYENRNVNYIADFTKDGFLDGSFFQSIENYFIDIFPYRENILAFHTYLDRSILKKPVVNDIVFSDDILLAKMNYAKCDEQKIKDDAEKMAVRLSSLNETTKKNGGKLYYVALNEQYSYFRDKYPDYIFNNEEKLEKTSEYFFNALESNNINYINMGKVFEGLGKKDSYYSKLDHHYSFEGAFITYQAIMDRLNSDCSFNTSKLEKSDFNFELLDNPYIGSRNRKLMGVYDFEEKLEIGYPKKNIPFERWDNGEKTQSKLFYYPEDKNQYITYLTYMGGDIAETVIKTNREELPNILIIGDSFTNPLESIIYTSFNEMHSLDFRKYNQMTAKEYIDKYKPDIVLIVRDDTSYFTFDGNGNI